MIDRSDTSDQEAGPPRDLKRELRLPDLVAIHVGNVLGSGIFVAPAVIAAAAPGILGGASLWLLGGLIAATGAACYAECGTRLPRCGGFYVYYREVYGLPVAFVAGWAALLVTYPASIAAIALIFGRYLPEAIPWLPVSPAIAAVTALVIVGSINVIGVRTAANVQRALTGIKVAALAAVCLAALFAGGSPAGDGPDPVPLAPLSLSALLGAMVVLLWTYDGWSDLSLAAGEVRNPGRILGRAVILGTSILIVLYVIVQVAVSSLLTPARAAGSERVLADAVQEGLGPQSGRIVALLVVVATFGSCHGIILAASRLGWAMARDRVFLGWFGTVHPRLHTPARAITVLTAASIIYVFSAGFRNLLAFFSFTVWIFYGLTAIALLILRRRRAGEAEAWHAPGGAAAPLALILVAVGMTAGLMTENPWRSLTGLALLMAGFPVYAIWRRFKKA